VLALIYSGYVFAHLSWTFGETSVYSPASIPIWQLKALIPIAGVVLLLQGISEVIRCTRCIRTGWWPARYHDVEEMETAILHAHEDVQAHPHGTGHGAGQGTER
jgi:TRAP-type mannitol/chloroaromatic compound transport system permease small subunit